MDATPAISIIIVSYNTRQLLADCLASIRTYARSAEIEIIVVDNNSADGSVEMLRDEFPEVRRIENKNNPGFGVANNQGFAISRGEFVLLLNSDTVLLEDTPGKLRDFMLRHPRAGAVAPLVRLMDGTRQPKTYGHLPTARVVFNQSLLLSSLFPRSRSFAGIFVEHSFGREMQVGWISGVCMLIRPEAYAAVDGFDPAFFLYAEDIDLCRRIVNAGWTIHRIDDHAIKHLCGGSSKSDQIVIRNGVLQQRNFLRLIDASTGPAGRAFARVSLAAGLAARVALRGLRLIVRPHGGRLSFHVSLKCLADILGVAGELDSAHARRN
ncbi:MAG TPA: glycosyltransferase family 2 protein [Opitutaceae bacterium]|nr:glycosyltransferase family 2 protein [Opitutaceae bacterium]